MTGCPSLTPHETKLALRHLRGRHKWRNRALLILGIRTGMRISELLSLRVSQVWNGKAMLPRLYLERQDSKGKRTGCSIVLHPRAAVAVEKWIKMRGPLRGTIGSFPARWTRTGTWAGMGAGISFTTAP